MAKWQDEWKTIYQTDSHWLRTKKDGSETVLEVADELETYEDEEGYEQHKFQLFRFDIERFKLVKDPEDFRKVYLVAYNYDKSWPHNLSAYEEWFASDLEAVARSAGIDALELAKKFTSADPRVRAEAYLDVGGHHGFMNFDTEPLLINEPELNKRWEA